jgi:phosphohistidine phosphatase SixA
MALSKPGRAAAVAVCLIALWSGRTGAAEINDHELVAALKTGGHVIYLRHGISDTTKTDADPVNIADCATQRPLSDQGRVQSRKIGATLRAAGIAVDRVFSSPYCRAVETAALAFPDLERKAVTALAYSLAMPKDDASRAAGEVKKMLASEPASGKNTVLIGHTSNLKEAAGIWPKKEGGAVVFRPDGKGSFVLVGTIDPAEFERTGM